jgi:ABC-2 type transport system ATP-binding protein
MIINKGKLVLFSGMEEIDEKAYSVTGPADKVRKATGKLHVIGETTAGGFLSRYVYDTRIADGEGYSLSSLGLQDFFIHLVGEERSVK